MKYYKNYLNNNQSFDKKTTFAIFCLIIVITGCFGWLYEFIFYYFNGGMKQWFWRGGNFLPWINIYATGSIIIYFLTYKQRKSPLKVFLISAIASGILEYFSGLGMYILGDGKRCWDYNSEILSYGSIGGFVCIRSVLVFGIFGLILIYGLIPLCFYIAQNTNKQIFIALSISLFTIIMIDELYNLIFARLLDIPRASAIYKQLGFHYVKFK